MIGLTLPERQRRQRHFVLSKFRPQSWQHLKTGENFLFQIIIIRDLKKEWRYQERMEIVFMLNKGWI